MITGFYYYFTFPSNLCQQPQLLVPNHSWKLLALTWTSSAKIAVAVWFILGRKGFGGGGEAEMSSKAEEAAALCQAASDTTETFSTRGRCAVRGSFTHSFPCLSYVGCKINCLSGNPLAVGQKPPSFKGRGGRAHKWSLVFTTFFQINDQLHLQSKISSCHHKSDSLLIDRHQKIYVYQYRSILICL